MLTIIQQCKFDTNAQFLEKKKKKDAISGKHNQVKLNRKRYVCRFSWQQWYFCLHSRSVTEHKGFRDIHMSSYNTSDDEYASWKSGLNAATMNFLCTHTGFISQRKWIYRQQQLFSWIMHEQSLRTTMLQHLLIGYHWQNSYISTLFLSLFSEEVLWNNTWPFYVWNVVFCKFNH